LWTVEVLPSAQRALRQLPASLREEILDTLQALQEDPFPFSRQLYGRADYYRIRFGVYRLIFRLSVEKRSILVTRIAHRSEVYEGYTPL
jgi:mRNA interferase RelE/StbE